MAVCLVGAVAVAQGRTDPRTQITMLLPWRASNAIDAELPPGEVCSAAFSDGPAWVWWVPGGRRWLRRRTVGLLRRAAARCRRG